MSGECLSDLRESAFGSGTCDLGTITYYYYSNTTTTTTTTTVHTQHGIHSYLYQVTLGSERANTAVRLLLCWVAKNVGSVIIERNVIIELS